MDNQRKYDERTPTQGIHGGTMAEADVSGYAMKEQNPAGNFGHKAAQELSMLMRSGSKVVQVGNVCHKGIAALE